MADVALSDTAFCADFSEGKENHLFGSNYGRHGCLAGESKLIFS